ncbi:MAG: hypothetical protein QXK80_03630 [Candidatus Pacearchaeota archaeon]
MKLLRLILIIILIILAYFWYKQSQLQYVPSHITTSEISFLSNEEVIANSRDEYVGGKTHDGITILADMDISQFKRNTGGSDGAGLCVFTSIEHSSRYQFLQLNEMQKFMRSRPGGGWPEKVDRIVKQYCNQYGVKEPVYFHVFDSRDTFKILKTALELRMMPCITWGTDYSHYGGAGIDHMVNLVHLDDKWGVILDNNFPNEYLWVRRPTFDRYATYRGFWAIIFVNKVAPPKPKE